MVDNSVKFNINEDVVHGISETIMAHKVLLIITYCLVVGPKPNMWSEEKRIYLIYHDHLQIEIVNELKGYEFMCNFACKILNN